MVTQGIGSEAENDAALISALGKKDGDTAKDVKEATEEAVKKAQEETEEAVAAEIDEAVTKGETEGKAGYDEDIAKYKGQEADMGHTGWVDVYSGEKDATPEVLKGKVASMQKLAMAEARKAQAGKH
uniref:Uncharacterized protein n=1 Tax=Hemiselmis andersenii TaxID=464988 RepID=A0A6T8IBJ7_HEMAN